MSVLAKLMIALGIDASEVKKGLGDVTGQARQAQGPFSDLGGAIGAAFGAITIGKIAATTTELVKVGAQAELLTKNFERLSGTDAASGLEEMREATGGLISDMSALQGANKFLIMGLAANTEEASKLAQMATQLGLAVRGDATGAMEDFALMLANQSILRLDNFGISSGRVRQRIEELQKQTAGMTREAAFMKAVMEEGERAMARVGDQAATTSGKVATLGSSFANVKTNIGQGLASSEMVSGVMGFFQKVLGGIEGFTGKLAAGNPMLKSFSAALKIMRDEGTITAQQYKELEGAATKLFYQFNYGGMTVDELRVKLAEISPTAAAVATSLAQPAAAMTQMANTVSLSMDQIRASLLGQTAEVNKALVSAFSTDEVTRQLTQYQQLVFDHQTEIARIEEDFAANRQEAEFNFNLQNLQARQQFEANYAALVAAGRMEDAAKAAQKFQTDQVMAKGSYSIQEQLQERSLIVQKIQQQRAYIEELKNQADQVRRTLALQITKAEGFAKLTAVEQRTLLDTVYAGGSARLQMEREIGERSNEIAKLTAQGNVAAAEAQVKAILALQQKDIEAAEAAMAAMQKQLEDFKIELPPLPTLDLRGIAAPRGAERATEPITKTLSQVTDDIAKGISASRQAIKDLLRFELPAGWDEGLEKLGIFLSQSVHKFYEVAEPIKGEIDALKDRLGPLNELMSLVSSSTQTLKAMAIREEMPDLGAWAQQVIDVLWNARQVVERAREWLNVGDVEQFKADMAVLNSLLTLAQADLGRMSMPAEEIGLKEWGTAMFDVLWTVREVLTRFNAEVNQLELEQQASTIPQLQALLQLVPTNLAGMSVPKEDFNLKDWSSWMLQILLTVRGVVNDVRSGIPEEELKEAANRVAEIKPYTDLIGTALGSIQIPDEGTNLKDWGQWMVAALLESRNVVKQVAAAIPEEELKAASDQVAKIKPYTELIGTNLISIQVPEEAPQFGRWAVMVVEAIRTAHKVVASLGKMFDPREFAELSKQVATVKPYTELLNINLEAIKVPRRKPNLGLWADMAELALLSAVGVVARIRSLIGDRLLNDSAEATDDLSKVAQLLGVDMARDFAVPPNYAQMIRGYIGAVDIGIELLIDWISSEPAEWRTTLLPQAATASEQMTKVMGLLGFTDAFAKLKDLQGVNVMGLFRAYVANVKQAVPLLVNELGPLVAEYQDGLDLVSDLSDVVSTITEALAGIAEGINRAMESGGINVSALGMLLRQFGAGLNEISRWGVPPGMASTMPPVLPPSIWSGAGIADLGDTGKPGREKGETILTLNILVNGKKRKQYPLRWEEAQEVAIDIGQDQATAP